MSLPTTTLRGYDPPGAGSLGSPAETLGRGLAAGGTAGVGLAVLELAWAAGQTGGTAPLLLRLAWPVTATLLPLGVIFGVAFHSVLRLRERGRLWIPAVLLGLSLYAVDQLVFPRLYLWAHVVLALTVGALAVLACWWGVGRLQRAAPAAISVVACALASSLVFVPAGERLRGDIADRTSLSAKVWDLVDYLFPAGPLAAAPVLLGAGGGAGSDPRKAAVPPALTPLVPPGSPVHLPGSPGADVLLVTVEALRADHVSAYGYGRPTTPYLDRLASRGVRFASAYAYAPGTALSITAIMAGRYTAAYATRDIASGIAPPVLWAEVLRSHGYRTVAVFWEKVLATDREALQEWEERSLGFEEATVLETGAPASAGAVNRIALEVARGADPRPLFLWAHYAEPHAPYDESPEHDFGPGDIDRYDAEIAVFDAALGELVTAFEARRKPLVIAVAGDHGEAFGEHGSYYHSTTLYDEQLRVPLVVVAPGLEPRLWLAPVSLVGLRGTLLGLVGIAPPEWATIGASLAPALLGVDPGTVVFAQVPRRSTAMVAREKWKLICNLRGGYCSLFDRRADPGERDNRIDADREVADALRIDLAREVERAANAVSGMPGALVAGYLGDRSAVAGLTGILLAAGSEHRLAAARLLGRLRADDAKAALLEVARHAATPEPLRAEVNLSLAALGTPVVIPDLRLRLAAATTTTPAPHAARLAAALVRLTGGTEGGEALLASLARVPKPIPRGEMWIWQEAVLAAALLGESTIESLVAFSRADKNVRWQVLEALRRIGGARAVEAIRAVRVWDPDAGNQVFAERCLAELTGGVGDASPPTATPGEAPAGR